MGINKQIIRPPALQPGDAVGLAAPAGPFPLERFRAGLARLEAWGLKPVYSDAIFDKTGFLAGPDESRAAYFNDLLHNPDLKAVFAVRGGHGSLRILDRIDYERLASRPIILLGFSDVTALLLAVHARTGLTVFHGPMVASLAEADDRSFDHLMKLLSGQNPFPISFDPSGAIATGLAEGPLLGGNLTLIVHLLAASRLPDPTGAILFLEDIDEKPYRLDRMLTTLRLAGVLGRLNGLILGEFKNCGAPEEIRDVFRRNLADFPGPVVSGFPIGHGKTNLALPIGPTARLDAEGGMLEMVENWSVG